MELLKEQKITKKFPKTSLTCLVGDLEFEKNINVRLESLKPFR